MSRVYPKQAKPVCIFVLTRGKNINKDCGRPCKKGMAVCTLHSKKYVPPVIEPECVEIPPALLPKKRINQATRTIVTSFQRSSEMYDGADERKGLTETAQAEIIAVQSRADGKLGKTQTMTNGRTRLKEKEKEQVVSIVGHIRSNTPVGQILKMAFSKKNPDEEIVDAIAEGGSNRDHYDFKMEVRNKLTGENTIKTVEHKGNLKDNLDFYRSCVQFFNGPATQFEVGEKYARGYYEMFVKSGVISAKYGICAEIPSYNEWKEVALSFTPKFTHKNAYTKELYEKTVHKTSKTPNGTKVEKREYTKIFNDLLTTEDKDTIMRQAIERANLVMREKYYWLNIKGDINGKFNTEWNTGLIQFMKPVSLEILKSVDCKYRIKCEDGNHVDLVIRWGRYDGICNLRIDLK